MFVRLLQLVRSFQKDESGVFAVIFGVMAIVLIATGGAAVDFTMLQQRRVAAQAALDGAVLGLQHRIEELPAAQLGEMALAIVRDRLADEAVTVELTDAAVDLAEGSLRVTARFDAPSYFVTLVGVHTLGASVVSQATRKSLRIEVAMVLDNSGSMAESNRMGHLRAAAHHATNIFFRDQQPNDANPSMFVGIVPFTQFVNVGTGNANAAWIDRRGLSSIANDNFQLDPKAPIDRFDRIALFDKMSNEDWRGCVEARPYPYDTNDTMPVWGSPDTLFVPLLAPDEPDTTNRWGQQLFNNSYIADQRGQCEAPPKNQSWTERTLQERMCKYDGARVSGQSMEQARGPNADCPFNEITPLTSRKSEVARGIAGLASQGGTNIAQGVVWGLHMLTPSAPLEAASFDRSVSKVMIVMTDGDNFHSASSNMNGANFYTAYGYPHNRRLGQPGDSTAHLRWLMDQRLRETCTNAKAMGITIYTIGLSVPSVSTENVLKQCSSGSGYWFMPKNPSELDGIFEKIADQLSRLRLTL